VAAFAAVGREVVLRETGPGVGHLTKEDLPAEAQRILESLGEAGVRPAPLAPADLRPLLRAAGGVLLLADPARRGVPALFEVTEAVLDDPHLPPEALLGFLRSAGQVIRL
jgi:hypothetical protein